MTEPNKFLQENAGENRLPGSCLEEAQKRFSLSQAEVERYSLQAALLPSRYQRNNKLISIEQLLPQLTDQTR